MALLDLRTPGCTRRDLANLAPGDYFVDEDGEQRVIVSIEFLDGTPDGRIKILDRTIS